MRAPLMMGILQSSLLDTLRMDEQQMWEVLQS